MDAAILHELRRGPRTQNDAFGEYVGRALTDLPPRIAARARRDIAVLLSDLAFQAADAESDGDE
jgi:hypothetical protein